MLLIWSLSMNTLYKCTITAILIVSILAGFFLLTKIAVAPITISEAHEVETVDFITPELKTICACESVGNWNAEPTQTRNGKLLRGRTTPEDVGACQINEHYHLENAKKLGFNIYLWTGNVGYANYLMTTQGTRPWSASKKCWDK